MHPKLDHEFYETVIMYNMLTDEPYLASIIDHLDQKFFEDKNISEIVGIVREYYLKRSSAPSLTEIKSYLTTPELKESFKKESSLKGLAEGC